MFTGLVEEVGQIRRIGRKGEALVLNIGASAIMDDLKIGDSVSVNGVCLTATTLESGDLPQMSCLKPTVIPI